MNQIISWIISALALLVAYLSFSHNLDKDGNADRDKISQGILEANIKLNQVCATTSEIKSDIKSMDKRINEFDKRLAIVERDVEDLKEGEK